MNNMYDDNDLVCNCCSKNLNTKVFLPKYGKFKKNHVTKDGNTLCFECAGFYLYETYLKNLNGPEIETIIAEINEINNIEMDNEIMEIVTKKVIAK